MKLSLVYLVDEIKLSENGGFVELRLKPVFNKITPGEGLHCVSYNTLITYDDYVRMHIKVGERLTVNLIRKGGIKYGVKR